MQGSLQGPQRASRGLAVRGIPRLSMGTPFSPGPLSVVTRGTSWEADVTPLSPARISPHGRRRARGPWESGPRALSLQGPGPAPTAAVAASESGLPGHVGPPHHRPRPPPGAAGPGLVVFSHIRTALQRAVKVKRDTPSGSKVLGPQPRPGLRSGRPPVAAPEVCAGRGHSLISMQGSPGSGGRRGRWSGLQGTVSLGQPLAPSPAEQSALFREGLRTWGHRRWPWGSTRAVLAPAGPSVFLTPMPPGVGGAVSSERTLNALFAPAPLRLLASIPPARCFAPSAGPAPALSLCPPRAPRRALHAFGLGQPPLCGLIFHQT